jgi:excisionase family DNA binding protein
VTYDEDEAKRDETAAIFARIPRAEAEKLNRLSFELKRPKQEIIAGLVAQYGEGEPGGPSLEPGVAAEPWGLGRIALRAAEPSEVLTLEQLAELLQVHVEKARELAESGEVPARRIGDEWRFSRQAVLDWLRGATT